VLISHRKKFIYTKTYKTGSTSVEAYFERYCMSDSVWESLQAKREKEEYILAAKTYSALDIELLVEKAEYVSPEGIVGFSGTKLSGQTWYNHLPAGALLFMLGPEIWNSYFKFCCIRNPFDKAISMFHWYIKLCEIKKAREIFKDHDPKYVTLNHKMQDIKHEFRQWGLLGGLESLHRDCKYYLIDGKICMDYFIRFENYEDGIRDVCNILDIDYDLTGLPRHKSGVRPKDIPYSDYYDSETIAAVNKIFRFELETFNYSFPGKDH
jgi:hypothetical protein